MITILIQTHNEEKNIAECIASAKLLTQSILVVDMESTDKTRENAKNAGAELLTFPYSHYVEPARSFGISQIDSDWIFILDADERMTDDLAREIQRIITSTKHTYFKVPRKNIFGGKTWLKYGGWWPDHQMRLIKRSAFRDWPARIHATPVIEGSMGFLQEPFLHYFHGNIEQMVEKTLVFEDIESNLLLNANKDVSVAIFFRKFLGELWRRLIIGKGFLDGKIGIMESIYQAFSKTITYLLLYEKKNRRTVHTIS